MSCEVCSNKATIKYQLHFKEYPKQIIMMCKRCLKDLENEEITKGDLHVTHNSNLY